MNLNATVLAIFIILTMIYAVRTNKINIDKKGIEINKLYYFLNNYFIYLFIFYLIICKIKDTDCKKNMAYILMGSIFGFIIGFLFVYTLLCTFMIRMALNKKENTTDNIFEQFKNADIYKKENIINLK